MVCRMSGPLELTAHLEGNIIKRFKSEQLNGKWVILSCKRYTTVLVMLDSRKIFISEKNEVKEIRYIKEGEIQILQLKERVLEITVQ